MTTTDVLPTVGTRYRRRPGLAEAPGTSPVIPIGRRQITDQPGRAEALTGRLPS